jgi:cell division septum initiation protein DivIVA
VNVRKVNVDVRAKLAEIRQAVEQARSMPMSASAVVNRAELLDMIRELEVEMEEAFSEASRIQRQRDEVLAEGRREAEGLRKETDDYVDAKLATFEITLDRTMEEVRRGRQRLAGRSALDSLTEDEVDRIKLPEHLEG